MGVGGQLHAPAALTPGMTRYPLYRRLGKPQGRSGRVLKVSPPPGFDPRTVQFNGKEGQTMTGKCRTTVVLPAVWSLYPLS